jgi:hypothetical protein
MEPYCSAYKAKEEFYQLLLDEPKLKDTIARYCKVEGCTVQDFKDFYNFLLPDTRPAPKPDLNYKLPKWATRGNE